MTKRKRIDDLKREIDNLKKLKEEATSDWNQHLDESFHHLKKAQEAEKRMFELRDQIEYRQAAILELEDEMNGQICSGIA